MSSEASIRVENTNILNKEAIANLLRENATIFEYDYGTKQVNLSWDQRRKKIIRSVEDIKPFRNYHIITGEGNILDLDLDCKETRMLADYFMPPTQFKYGRESKPASHWIYKVLDLNKKHTRKFFIFEDRKYSEIGAIFKNQYQGGIYEVESWSHLINFHLISGDSNVKVYQNLERKENQGGIFFIY